MDMKSSELRMVAEHMGHNINIHTDIYRLQTYLLEKTKLVRVLIALENDTVGKFDRCNLQDINEESMSKCHYYV